MSEKQTAGPSDYTDSSGPSKATARLENRCETPNAKSTIRPLGTFRSTSTDASPSRAISNQGKRPEAHGSASPNITRSGAPKMSFTAKVVGKRKSEIPVPAVTQASTDPASSSLPDTGRGRGSDRGRGRGGVPQQAVRGVFSQGPSHGTPLRHSAYITRQRGREVDGANPSLKSRMGTLGHSKNESDVDQYSDEDDLDKVVDINTMNDDQDWGMPVVLKRVKEEKDKDRLAKKRINDAKAKVEQEDVSIPNHPEVDQKANEPEVDFANALDLSESEEEEELEDFIGDFLLHPEPENPSVDASGDMPLYFFQFPSPFPAFHMPKTLNDSEDKVAERMDIDIESTVAPSSEEAKGVHGVPPQSAAPTRKKSVSFAPETKPPAPSPVASVTEECAVDGIIGELLIYRSGVVKMKLGNGIMMDVTAATQPSFLQHVVYLDHSRKDDLEEEKQDKRIEFTKMTVIGEVSRQFVVSPDIDAMLDELELGSKKQQSGMPNRTEFG